MRDSLNWASSTSAMSFGENDRVLKSMPPDRTAGRPIVDMRASTHADCRSRAWAAFRLLRVDEDGVGDATGRGQRAGVAGEGVGGDETAGAGLERAVAVGFADGLLVRDVQDVGGDVAVSRSCSGAGRHGRCRR